MSRVLNHKCSCGYEYGVSFGHPEKSFTHKWVCEMCEAEHSHYVEEWISSKGSQNDVIIHNGDSTTLLRIFTSFSDSGKFIPLDILKWNEYEDLYEAAMFGGWLRLEDVSNQLSEKGHMIIYVWVESPCYGVMYQFGNYDNKTWHLYCKTPGYA